MGWQDLQPIVRKAYQSKGGSVHTPKGFAKMDKEKHLAVAAQGGRSKRKSLEIAEIPTTLEYILDEFNKAQDEL